jgi:regulator of protease activity HflC (stomatin/prohibitin superfamily)
MAITPPPAPPRRYSGSPEMPQMPQIPGRVLLIGLIPLLVVLGLCYWWFVQRVEVPNGQVLVLVRKVGEPLPAEAGDNVVLYPALLEKLGEPPDSTRYKGIMYEVKPEGRYFYDPFFWEREIRPMTFVAADEVGILIRKYGEPLAEGKVVATDPHERGPLKQVLSKGRHNINPYAYNVKRVKRVRVPEGSVGVQTLYAGGEPANPNRYVVEKDERGVQPDVLPPGLYDVNPYVRRIDTIDIRSHTIDFRADEAIHFPSKDSFEILIEGTVEYAIQQEKAPYVMAAIGDHEDIRAKLILPFMRSLARIEGSKLEGREFISGETRRAFQDRVFDGLRQQSKAQGIEIRAALIRRIEPPAEIAGPISERQLADQQSQQYQNEIRLADAQARLAEQEEMQKQNQEIGKANREVVTTVVQAEQRQAVALTEANKRLEVARLNLEASQETAAALLSRGQADAEVIKLEYEAKARPLRDAIGAFGGGDAYAQYFFYQKLAPALKTVLDSTEGPFADIFRSLSERQVSVPASGGEQARND